jgi:hypothetical protein
MAIEIILTELLNSSIIVQIAIRIFSVMIFFYLKINVHYTLIHQFKDKIILPNGITIYDFKNYIDQLAAVTA